MEEVRAFIAIELPDKLKEEFRHLQSQLKSGDNCPVKWVDPQGIHLTLKFLGGVPADKLDKITEVLVGVTAGIPPFRLQVTELDVFPNLRRVQVVWVGLSGDLDTLRQLQKRIETGLVLLGFPAEARDFTPHLTLGRVRENALPEERQSLGQLVVGAKFKATAAIEVDYINLMRSQLTRAGAIYSVISSIKLDKPL